MSKICSDIECENSELYPDEEDIVMCPQCNAKLEPFVDLSEIEDAEEDEDDEDMFDDNHKYEEYD